MKRTISLILMLLTITFALSTTYKFSFDKKIEVNALENVSTGVISPSSYPEYLEVSSPVDVFVDGVNTNEDYLVAIAEQHKIHMYRDGKYKTYALTDYTVSKITVYGEYIIFLSSSGIYYFSDETQVENGCVKAIDSGVKSANSFAINGNELIVNPSGVIRTYEIKTTETGLEFSDKSSTSIGITPSCLVYDDGNIYYFYEKKLIKFSNGTATEIAQNLKEPRYAVAGNGKIFFSSADGIYTVDLQTGSVSTDPMIAVGSVNALASLVSPQGLYLYGKSLYIADSEVDAVMEVNIDTGKFTDFAITARGDLKNRITSQAKAITANDNAVFVLDDSQVKKYDLESKSFSAEKIEGIGGSDKIAATDKNLLITSSDDINLFTMTKDGNYERTEILTDTANYKNVAAVCASDNDFYFVDNELKESVSYATVYKIDVTTKTIKKTATIKGTGEIITADIFGRLYVTIYENGEYKVYSDETGEFTEATRIISTTIKPLTMFVDMEGKVYFLWEANKVTVYTTGENVTTETYELSLSENLPNTTAIDGCLVPSSDKTYFLYKGFILTAKTTLGIATPEKITVPESYSLTLNDSPEKAYIQKDARYFEVDLKETAENTTFDYVGYGAEENEEEYILLAETDRYALVTNDKKSAIVRKEDIIKSSERIESSSGERYIVTDINAYYYPVADEAFEAFKLSKNEKVEVKGTIVLNGKKFTLIKSGENEGYVPSSMLKTAIAADSTTHEFYTATVGSKGAKVYADENLTTEIGQIDGMTDVIVYSDDGKTAKILFDDTTIGYIKSSTLKKRGYYAVRNLMIVVVIIFAIASTAYYLLKTRVFKKK